jgi:2-oxoglutarate/2-oxoacid ferredoxin oxidoreductase subunit alpha
VYVVEQNRDAQMLTLLRADLPADATTHVRSVLHYSGLPIDARSVTDDILVQEGRKERARAVAVTATVATHSTE